MDFYAKKKLANLGLTVLFILGLVLQFVGLKHTGYGGLGLQFISLALLIVVLWLYNRRYQ